MSKKDKKIKKNKKDKVLKKDKKIIVKSKTPISKIRNQILSKKPNTTTPTKKTNNSTSEKKLTVLLKEIDKIHETLTSPSLIVISGGIGSDGKIKMEMKWNNAFIKNVNKSGISGQTEEQTAMLFLVGCQLKPEEFGLHEEDVVSEAHPLLSAESHELKK